MSTPTPSRVGAAAAALAFGIFVLVTSEFLPASLLPAIADSMEVTVGVAGQTVTATALVGCLAAPVIVVGLAKG